MYVFTYSTNAFLLKIVDFRYLGDTIRPKRKRYIPIVLSKKEVNKIFKHLEYPYDLLTKLLYGCGLRLNEGITLRVHNFNFDEGILTVRGKGEKTRTVPLPDSIMADLKSHLERVKNLHESDLKNYYNGVFLPNALDKKYRNAAKEFVWQWFFPAKELTYAPATKEQKRYHLHDVFSIFENRPSNSAGLRGFAPFNCRRKVINRINGSLGGLIT